MGHNKLVVALATTFWAAKIIFEAFVSIKGYGNFVMAQSRNGPRFVIRSPFSAKWGVDRVVNCYVSKATKLVCVAFGGPLWATITKL